MGMINISVGKYIKGQLTAGNKDNDNSLKVHSVDDADCVIDLCEMSGLWGSL
jgi:hypothetical protein